MKLAAAQTVPKDGNIEANIKDHCRLAIMAADQGARLILFPEMSLTGYQRERAAEFAFTTDDTRLASLQEIATKRDIIIMAGAPVSASGQLYIGTLILQPGGQTKLYTKQFLHEGEEVSFAPSDEYNPVVQLEGERIVAAICADINYPQHAAQAKELGGTIYAADIFYKPERTAFAHEQLAGYAATYDMHVLMANYGGPSYNVDGGGRSSYWTSDGTKIVEAPASGERLLVVSYDNTWQGKTLTGNE